MKLINMSGRVVSVKINPADFPIRGTGSKSKIQTRVGEALQKRFKLQTILEEWTIPASRMSLDFFLPNIKVACEIQGEQHRKFSKFFHGSIQGFKEQLKRDSEKREWCKMNDIELIEIYEEDDIEEKLK